MNILFWIFSLSIPLTFAAEYMGLSPIPVFIIAAAAIIFLARLISHATEELSLHYGENIGAFLSATFGNAVELIIAILALNQGLYEIVKASILGAILVNLLFTLGLCIVLGGMKYPIQKFNQTKAIVNGSMLFIVVIGVVMPSVYSLYKQPAPHAEAVSLGVAFVLMFVYLLGLFFNMKTHKKFLGAVKLEVKESPEWGKLKAFVIMIVGTILVAFVSEVLVGKVEPIAHQLGWNQAFIGLFFLPAIGMASELFSAVKMALRNRMDGSLEITLGASLQIAMFIAPMLVFVGYFTGHPLTLMFTGYEVIIILLTTLIVNLVSYDGQSNWYEGVLMMASYFIFGVVLFYI
jgi:Ca2+:H+ antiporter